MRIVINEHSPIYFELIELLTFTLRELGHTVTITENQMASGPVNLLVGATAFLTQQQYTAIRSFRGHFIVFQNEVLADDAGFVREPPGYVEFLAGASQIWDYSPTNLPFLNLHGCRRVHYIPIGYAPSLERIVHAPERDIDVLFYGSINPRRERLLLAVTQSQLKLKALFGVYGAARDREIARAKVVLNVHQFDAPHLEELRLAYLLNNRCFIVSEKADRNPYGRGVVFREYDDLVDCCVAYCAAGMDSERNAVANEGYAMLKGISTAVGVRVALERLGSEF